MLDPMCVTGAFLAGCSALLFRPILTHRPASPGNRAVRIASRRDMVGPTGVPDIKKTRAILWGVLGNNHCFAVGEKLAEAFSVMKNARQRPFR